MLSFLRECFEAEKQLKAKLINYQDEKQKVIDKENAKLQKIQDDKEEVARKKVADEKIKQDKIDEQLKNEEDEAEIERLQKEKDKSISQ